MSESIRTAVTEEWDQIEQLLAAAGLPTDDLNESACALFRVCVEDSRLAGAVALEPLASQVAMLRSLAVAPDARSRGIGRALVENLEAWARARQVEEIFLLTTTADRFFTRIGYERIERGTAPDSVKAHAQFQALCPASAVLMHKRLLP